MTGAVRSTTNNLGLGLLNFNFPNWGDDANNNTRIMDAAFSLTGVSLSGVWNNNTSYTNGELLVDPDTNEVYRCEVTHTSALTGTFEADRVLHPTYWTLASTNYQFRGEWEGPGVSYAVGDLVYDEAQYVYAVCLVQHVSTTGIRADEAAGKWLFIVDLFDAVTAAEAAAASAAESAEIASGIVSGEIGPAIAGSPRKTALVAGDRFAITNSETGHVLNHSRWEDITAAMEAITDLLYAPIVHTHLIADVTGLQAALDLKAPLNAPTLTGAVQITGTLTLNADPASGLQAATKQYVDGLLTNIGKRSTVRAATTANIIIATALNAGDTLDGVVLNNGDYVLVKNQAAAETNGVYIVSPAPERAPEYDTYDEHAGSLIAVQEGSANADKLFLCTANTGGTLGTNSINYTQMVTAGEMLAANNLSDVANAATAFANIKQNASETATGVVEMATTAEAAAGTDTSRAVTAAGVLAAIQAFGSNERVVLTPSASQNNYATGISVRRGVNSIIAIAPTNSIVISGISTTSFETGKRIIIKNETSRIGNDARMIILPRSSALSSAANRFEYPGNKRLPLILMPQESAEFYFNGTHWQFICASRPLNLFGYFDGLINPFLAYGFGAWVSGTGANGVTGQGSDINTDVYQHFTLSTGTTATGRAASIDNDSTIRLGQGALLNLSRVNVPILSDAGQEFDVFVGFTETVAAPADGVFWVYDRNTSANWRFNARDNSVATVVDSGIAVVAGTAIGSHPLLGIFINGNGTNAEAFYSTDEGVTWNIHATPLTTNLPNTARNFGYGTSIVKSVGTTARELRTMFSGTLGYL